MANHLRHYASFLIILVFASNVIAAQRQKCKPSFPASLQLEAVSDQHTLSNPDQVRVTHVDLDLTVDFNHKTLEGSATLDLQRIAKPDKTSFLFLDTEDLNIKRVETASADAKFVPGEFEMGEKTKFLGTALSIPLAPSTQRVRVTYSTSSSASALQWLTPQQTSGKSLPYLYTQSESTHARSWIPLQDSPAFRVTYTAKIHTPKNLIALMSADGNVQPSAIVKIQTPGEFSFKMDIPIPPYLIALAVGDLAFRSLGPRAGVYDEPSAVDRDAKELEDVERMIRIAEKLYGPYFWGRYDVLVLPPSAPYGGMENPRLTFASPTIIAGDKSGVSVISHELAHSWSGNTITNATWSDFWLNEGFTTYIERRIVEAVFGKKLAEMQSDLGRRELEKTLKELPPIDQVLHVNLDGREADDGATLIPYEKGALFLVALERVFGREKFDEFLKSYFSHFRLHSITTKDFLNYLQAYLLETNPGLAVKIPVQEWLYDPGLPPSAPQINAPAFDAVEDQARNWLSGKIPVSGMYTKDWSGAEWQHFLEFLPRNIGADKLSQLDSQFHLTQSGNIEITLDWLLLAVGNHYEPANARLEQVLLTVGRGKIVEPLYRELVKTPEGKRRARALFERAKSTYHPIVANTVSQIVSQNH